MLNCKAMQPDFSKHHSIHFVLLEELLKFSGRPCLFTEDK